MNVLRSMSRSSFRLDLFVSETEHANESVSASVLASASIVDSLERIWQGSGFCCAARDRVDVTGRGRATDTLRADANNTSSSGGRGRAGGRSGTVVTEALGGGFSFICDTEDARTFSRSSIWRRSNAIQYS